MSDPLAARPAICLNMIVRNEAHIVAETLDNTAPYISSWVIVDTGSDDGTQDVIRSHMARLGIPGELHQRPWRNFGHNRTEALALAQGRGDYIWVIDADDIVVGTPDFTGLTADIYTVRRKLDSTVYWHPELFRNGVCARWVGVTHEYATYDEPHVAARLEGAYHIQDRQLSSRNLSGAKLTRDRELLQAEVERNPEDARSVFYLAQTYLDLGDFANARMWYARRIEMGGWKGEVFYAMYRLAVMMHELREPWPEVQDAYLRAWEFRPSRAEPLYCIAHAYRMDQRFHLGYTFARQAAEIPFPADDPMLVQAEVYAWRALDEQAVCASRVGRHAEAFKLCRDLLARPDLPDADRQRMVVNRDFSVPAMLDAASSYPDALVDSLTAGADDADVTVTLIAGPDLASTEQTVNSFLRCCLDIRRVGRFLMVDAGLSAEDRATLAERYGFLQFTDAGPGGQLSRIRAQVGGRRWLHLGRGWRFFAPENLITRLTAVLDAEPQVFQVGINFTDATKLTGACAAEEAVRRTDDAGRYLLADAVADGPAMFDTARLDRAGDVDESAADPAAELARAAAAAGLRMATLDEVLCIAAV